MRLHVRCIGLGRCSSKLWVEVVELCVSAIEHWYTEMPVPAVVHPQVHNRCSHGLHHATAGLHVRLEYVNTHELAMHCLRLCMRQGNEAASFCKKRCLSRCQAC